MKKFWNFNNYFKGAVKLNILTLGILIFLILAGIFSGQNSIPPIDRDEARFAQASRQMAQSNDYINIKFQDEIRAKKPIGIYWLQAFSTKILGLEDIGSFRVPSLLSSLISIIFVGLLTRLIFPLYQTIIVTLLFASSIAFMGEAHLAKTDATLLCLICIQQYFLLRLILDKDISSRVKYLYSIIIWVAFSFGVLVKGPISFAILIPTVILFCFFQKSIDLIKSLKPILGIVICAFIIFPWFFAIEEATQGEFLQKALEQDFFSKLKSGQEGHGAPPGTHLLFLSIAIWPIATFLPCLTLFCIQNKNNKVVQFLISWIVPFWIIIEIIPTKLFHYSLPVLPAITILAIGGMFQFKSNIKKIKNTSLKNLIYFSSVLFGFSGIILGIGYFYTSYKFNLDKDFSLISLTFLIILITILVFLLSLLLIFNVKAVNKINNKYFNRIPLAIIALGAIFNIINYNFILPKLDYLFPSKIIAKKIDLIEPETITSSGYHEPSLVFLLNGNVLLSKPHEAAIFMAEGKKNISLIEKRSLRDFLESIEQLNLKVKIVDTIKGFNIAKGRHVEINIFKNQMFDQSD